MNILFTIAISNILYRKGIIQAANIINQGIKKFKNKI